MEQKALMIMAIFILALSSLWNIVVAFLVVSNYLIFFKRMATFEAYIKDAEN